MTTTGKSIETPLRRLRRELGLSQPDMAARLGLPLSTYRAYEYGQLRKIPPKVAAAARELTIDPQYSYIRALYGGRPMHDVVREWAQRMGVDENNRTEIAAALGIHKSTVSRWLSDEESVELSAEELIKYDRRVEQEAAYFLAMKSRRVQ